MPKVCKALDKVRQISEDELRPEWFSKAQETVLVGQAFEACRDKLFWGWVSCAGREVYEPADELRRWGGMCGCPEHVQARQNRDKYPACCYCGRRLEEAWPHIKVTCAKWMKRADDMTLDDTEGSQQLFTYITKVLRQQAQMLKHRSRYAGIPPWSFALVLTVTGAQDWLDDVQRRPMTDHDCVTNVLHLRVGDHPGASSRGGRAPCLEGGAPRLLLGLLERSTRRRLPSQYLARAAACECQWFGAS